MRLRQIRCGRAVVAGSILLAVVTASGAAASAGDGVWRALGPAPGDRTTRVGDFVVDRAGTPWVMAGGGVYWWDGRQWVQAKDGETAYRSGHYVATLQGGPDRGAWMTQVGSTEHEGRLFKLAGGRVTPAGAFYYDVGHYYPGLYVSRSGDVFNYSTRFLAVRGDGDWKRVETTMGLMPSAVEVVDFGPEGPVVFMSRRDTVAAVWDGKKLHANVPVQGAPPDDPKRPVWLSACRWGKNRMLLWRRGKPGLGAARAAEGRLTKVDVQAVLARIGADSTIHDGWGAPDGSAWLYVRRPREDHCHFVRITPDGRVTTLSAAAAGKIGWEADRFHRYPQSVLPAADGSVWLGLARGGVARLRGETVEAVGWQRGLGSDSIPWIFAAPDGRLYAAGDQVYRWDADSRAEPDPAEAWEESLTAASPSPLIAPDGRLWMFLADRPGKVSAWNGRNWTHIAVPFDTRQAGRLVADDRGALIVQMLAYPDGTHIVSPAGVQRHVNLPQALAERVAQGARKFRSEGVLGPVVDKRGRAWYSYQGYDYVHGCFDGKWEQFALKGTLCIALDADGDGPFFCTSQGWWAYREGQIVRTPQKPTETVRVLLPLRMPGVPYCKGLSEALLADALPVTSAGGRGWVPISWQDAAAIADGRPWKRPPGLERSPLSAPAAAFPDGRGGYWICSDSIRPLRVWHGCLIPLERRGTPLVSRSVLAMGMGPAGRVWIDAGWYGGARHVFFRTAKPPTVTLEDLTVTRGRVVTAEWRAEPTAAAVAYRLGEDEAWRVATGDSGALRLHAGKPGRYEMALTVQAIDAVGVVGPPAVAKATVDVKLPRIRWAGGSPPRVVDTAIWRVPVEVDWAFADVRRRIEVRIDDGDWQALAEGGELPVFHLNNRPVRFAFRAVEEDIFYSPQTLSAPIGVEIKLQEWIEKRVEAAMAADEKIRQQAIRDLALVSAEALPILRACLAQKQADVAGLADLIRRIESAVAASRPGN